MIKIVTPNKDKVNGIIHDNLIVERTSNSGKQMFNIMVEDINLDLTTGFIGGKKTAFITAPSLEIMRASIAANGLKEGSPLVGMRIVYNETTTPPADKNYQKVPMVIENENGSISIQNDVFVKYKGKDIFRKSYIVYNESPERDNILPHDKYEDTSVNTMDALKQASKTTVK